MVNRVKGLTGLSGTGSKDWFLQRISGIILAVYTVFLVAYLISHAPVNYQTWSALFSCTAMKIFTLFALISVVWHAWVGIWTIFTDYITCVSVRAVLQMLVVFTLVICLLWAIRIIW